MEGSGCGDDGSSVVSSPYDGAKNFVLVGRTGGGKSATGNSIIGEKVFDEMPSLGGVTMTSQKHTNVLEDGQILNVIDTPGLFSTTVNNDYVANEIAKCVDILNNGIHAILVVLSARNRFSQEEEVVVKTLQRIFGEKIADCMIVVFTGGDEFGEDDSLDTFLSRRLPEPLERILQICGNRRVLFDNKTEDEFKKSKQVKELLSLVSAVAEKNDGKQYTNELLVELKMGDLTITDQVVSKICEEQLNGFCETVALKLSDQSAKFMDSLIKKYEEQLNIFHETLALSNVYAAAPPGDKHVIPLRVASDSSTQPTSAISSILPTEPIASSVSSSLVASDDSSGLQMPSSVVPTGPSASSSASGSLVASAASDDSSGRENAVLQVPPRRPRQRKMTEEEVLQRIREREGLDRSVCLKLNNCDALVNVQDIWNYLQQ